MQVAERGMRARLGRNNPSFLRRRTAAHAFVRTGCGGVQFEPTTTSDDCRAAQVDITDGGLRAPESDDRRRMALRSYPDEGNVTSTTRLAQGSSAHKRIAVADFHRLRVLTELGATG